MKGNPNVIATLKAGLSKEGQLNLQCRLDARVLKHLGLNKIAGKINGHGNDAHDYIKCVTDRILFLEGDASYSFGELKQAGSVTDLLKNQLALHNAIVQPYEDAVQIAQKALDDTTRNLFEHLLKWHQCNVNWLEKQLRLIDALGEANYIAGKL